MTKRTTLHWATGSTIEIRIEDVRIGDQVLLKWIKAPGRGHRKHLIARISNGVQFEIIDRDGQIETIQ